MSSVPQSPQEAREAFRSLKKELSDLTGRVDAFSTWLENTNDRVAELEDENQQLHNRLDALEARLEIIEDGCATKEGKVRAIVQQAKNLRVGDQAGVVMTPAQIVAATGCSKRYAYDLCDGDDGLPPEYAWIVTREQARSEQYGAIEIEGDKQGKALVVDFERLHSDEDALNKFNNGSTGEGV